MLWQSKLVEQMKAPTNFFIFREAGPSKRHKEDQPGPSRTRSESAQPGPSKTRSELVAGPSKKRNDANKPGPSRERSENIAGPSKHRNGSEQAKPGAKRRLIPLESPDYDESSSDEILL